MTEDFKNIESAYGKRGKNYFVENLIINSRVKGEIVKMSG
jgi:hypothetical protein